MAFLLDDVFKDVWIASTLETQRHVFSPNQEAVLQSVQYTKDCLSLEQRAGTCTADCKRFRFSKFKTPLIQCNCHLCGIFRQFLQNQKLGSVISKTENPDAL